MHCNQLTYLPPCLSQEDFVEVITSVWIRGPEDPHSFLHTRTQQQVLSMQMGIPNWQSDCTQVLDFPASRATAWMLPGRRVVLAAVAQSSMMRATGLLFAALNTLGKARHPVCGVGKDSLPQRKAVIILNILISKSFHPFYPFVPWSVTKTL